METRKARGEWTGVHRARKGNLYLGHSLYAKTFIKVTNLINGSTPENLLAPDQFPLFVILLNRHIYLK